MVDAPPSKLPPEPESCFSISSILITIGDILSAILISVLKLRSESPTYMPKTFPKSHFNNIRLKIDAKALDAIVFPTPGGPSKSTPFGAGNPNLDSPKKPSLIS